jgi:hypothetical protein
MVGARASINGTHHETQPMQHRFALRARPLFVSFVFASACAPAAPSSDAGDASALDQTPPPTDAAADRALTVEDAAPDVAPTCVDCGPNGHAHGDHCHCDPGYIERNQCCVAAPRCSMPDDMLEENDTVATATGTTPSYSQPSLRVCPVDNETFSHASGDIDAYLFAPGVTDLAHSRPVGGSDGTADNEAFSFTATAAGDHHLLIVGHNGAENAYGLQLTVSGP